MKPPPARRPAIISYRFAVALTALNIVGMLAFWSQLQVNLDGKERVIKPE